MFFFLKKKISKILITRIKRHLKITLKKLTNHSWACAVPTALATILILMRDMIFSWFTQVAQRKKILSIRKQGKRRPRRL